MPNMGIGRNRASPSPSTGLADALFSTTQQRVLGYLFGQPQRSFFANELIRLTGSGSGAVQRELGRLVERRLLTVSRVGNQKHYQANPASPIFDQVCGIVQKNLRSSRPFA